MSTWPPLSDAPIFQAGVNVFTAPMRFEEWTDVAEGDRAGMGNQEWVQQTNPLFDADDPLYAGLTDKDFMGFWATIMQPLAQTLSRGGSNEATQAGSLYGPREFASIILPDWRFMWVDVYYHIVGRPNWDMNHALTNENFGYVEFACRKGG